MELICESALINDYLSELEAIDYSHAYIQQTLLQLHNANANTLTKIQRAFEFVRDEIHHSVDIQSPRVTYKASEVIQYKEGLCYAKSHALAALLRAQSIPTGFCYQRLLNGTTPADGYSLHGLNAIYLEDEARWIRLDARGNKPGVQSEFSIHEERLAFSVDPQQGEIDYPTIYAKPHPVIIHTLTTHTDCLHLCQYSLPAAL